MKKVFKHLAKLLPITVLAVALTSTIASAATVGFSYEGWGIRWKGTVSSAYVSAGSTIYANHYQRRDQLVPSSLRIAIYKDNWYGNSLFHYETFSEMVILFVVNVMYLSQVHII